MQFCPFVCMSHQDGLTLYCVLGWKSRSAVPSLVEGYLGGKVKVNEFVTHVLPLDQVQPFRLFFLVLSLSSPFFLSLFSHFAHVASFYALNCVGRNE